MPARRRFALTLVLMLLTAACIPPPDRYVAGTVAPGSERSGRLISAAGFADAEAGMLAVNAGSTDGGGPSVLMATTDGGGTWNRGFGSDGPIVTIDFVSPQLGWFATELMLFATRDGGASWKPVPGTRVEQIEQVDFVDATHGWVRGRGAERAQPGGQVVMRTTDGGKTWERSAQPVEVRGSTPGMISFISPDEGWYASGDYGGTQCQGSQTRLWHTRDGGTTWQLVAASAPSGGTSALPGDGCLSGLSFADPNHGWLTYGHSGLFATEDGGKSWSLVRPPIADVEQLPASPHMVTPGTGFVVYDGRALWRAVENGRSWEQVYPAP